MVIINVCINRGYNPGGGMSFSVLHAHPDRPWGPTSVLYENTGTRSRSQSGRGVALITLPRLALRFRMSRAIFILPPFTSSWHVMR